VGVASHSFAGSVNFDSSGGGTLAEDPISSSFDIAPGVTGELRQSSMSGRYADSGSPATYDVFPVSSFPVISVSTSYYTSPQPSDGGYGFNPGISNVNLDTNTAITIPGVFVPLTLNVDSGGRTDNAGPLQIIANDGSFTSSGAYSGSSSNLNLPANGVYMVPANVPFHFIMIGGAGRSGGEAGVSPGPFPPSWQLTSDTITVNAPTTINITLPPTVDIKASYSNTVQFGTGQVTVSDDAANPISVSYTGGEAVLKAYKESEQTGGDFYLFDTGTNLETVTVTTRGEIGTQYSSVVTHLNLNGVPASSTQTVRSDLTYGGSLTGQINSPHGASGILSYVAEKSSTGSFTFGDSDGSGNIVAGAPLGLDKVTIQGTNVPDTNGMPPYWWMVVDASSSDIGTFELPTPESVQLQVVDELGLPIPGATIAEILSPDINESVTVTSSNGTKGYLYNGGVDESFGGVSQWSGPLSFTPSSFSITDSNGYATLVRFNTGPIGELLLSLPGEGSNPPLEIKVSSDLINENVVPVNLRR